MDKNKISVGVVGVASAASLLAALMIVDFEFNAEWSQPIIDVSFFAGLAIFIALLVFVGILLFKKDLKISAKRSVIAFKCALFANIIILVVLNIANYLKYQNRDIESSFEPYYSMMVFNWPALPLVIISVLFSYKHLSQRIRIVSMLALTVATIMIVSTILYGRLGA